MCLKSLKPDTINKMHAPQNPEPFPAPERSIFRTVSKDVFLEVQNQECSQIWCLLGYIACTVHLCTNKIWNFPGNPKFPSSCKAHRPGLGTGMLYAQSEQWQRNAPPGWSPNRRKGVQAWRRGHRGHPGAFVQLPTQSKNNQILSLARTP